MKFLLDFSELLVGEMFQRVTVMSSMKSLMRGVSRLTPTLTRAVHSGTRTSSSVAPRAKHVERPLTSEEVFSREERYGAHNYHPLPVALDRGEGKHAQTSG